MHKRSQVTPARISNFSTIRQGRVKAAVDSNLSQNAKQHASYASGSDFLRQVYTGGNHSSSLSAYATPPRRIRSASNIGRANATSSGTRPPEDLQEEIMMVKRNVVALTNENVMLKTRLQKFQNEAAKKDQQIEELLDPEKVQKFSHSAMSQSGDSRMLVNSLKQKVLRLEQSLKDKDSILNKLKSDLKTSKIEEMRVQMDSFYNEILRLQRISQIQLSSSGGGVSGAPKELVARMKSLNETILRQNEINEKLQNENKKLHQKLDNTRAVQDESGQDEGEYSGWTKENLITHLLKLEKELETQKSIGEARLERNDTEEIQVKGIMAENEKLKAIIKRVKEDKEHYKHKLELKEKEIQGLKKVVRELEQSNLEKEKQMKSAKATFRRDSARGKEHLANRNPTLTPESSPEMSRSTSLRLNSENLRQQNAARKIQRGWKEYKDEKELNEAAEVIGSAARGHLTRKRFLEDQQTRHETDPSEDEESEERSRRSQDHSWKTKGSDSGIDDAASVIQAAAGGHLSRKKFLEEEKRFYTGKAGSNRRRHSSTRSQNNESESEDDDTIIVQRRKR